jgi:hypothetical protein
MDKLSIMDGVGFPLAQDDFDDMQTALREGIIGLGKAINPNASSYIVSGCSIVIDPTFTHVFALGPGAVVINGEPCVVVGSTGATNAEYYWYIDEQNSGSSVTFEDTGTHNPYLTRQAKLGSHANDATYTANVASGLWVPMAQVLKIVPDWIPIPAYTNGWAASGAAYYRIWGNGKVELKGAADGTLQSGIAAFTLPAGTWPPDDFYKLTMVTNGSNFEIGYVHITSAGVVNLITTTYDLVKLDGITFYIS